MEALGRAIQLQQQGQRPQELKQGIIGAVFLDADSPTSPARGTQDKTEVSPNKHRVRYCHTICLSIALQ